MLIVGASGHGKTSLLMRFLLERNLLNYDKLYIFAKSLYQPEYRVLQAGFENKLSKLNILKLLNLGEKIKDEKYWQNKIEDSDEDDIPTIESVAKGIALTQKKPNKLEAEFHTSADEIPDPADLNKTIRNLMVFDDIMSERNQDPASNYFTRGRSANCDSIYLSQNYTKLPLHSVRENSNIMIFFKLSSLVVEQLHRNFASLDMTLIEFRQLCEKTWKKKYNFLVIDLSRDFESGNKYRIQLELN